MISFPVGTAQSPHIPTKIDPKQDSPEPATLTVGGDEPGQDVIAVPEERVSLTDHRGIPWAHVPLDCDTSGRIRNAKDNIKHKLPAIERSFSKADLNEENEKAVLMSLHNALHAQGNYQAAFFGIPHVTNFIRANFKKLKELLSEKMGILLEKYDGGYRLKEAPGPAELFADVGGMVGASDCGQTLPQVLTELIVDRVLEIPKFDQENFESNIDILCGSGNVAWKNAFVAMAPGRYLKEILDTAQRNRRALNLTGVNNLSTALLSMNEGLGLLVLDRAILRGQDLRNLGERLWLIKKADLTGADLSGSYLRSADFSGTDLTSANLSETSFYNCQLDSANLTNANLSGASLSDMNLSQRDLRSVDLRRTRLTFVDLSGVNLSGKDLTELVPRKGVKLCNADLRGANLSKLDLTGADLRGAILDNANLQDADLTGCDLTGVSLRGANLSKANLSNVKLEMHQLQGPVFNERTGENQMERADLTNTVFNGATLTGEPNNRNGHSILLEVANLVGANLRNINLRNARYGINLLSATLTAVRLPNNITNWNFRNAIFNSMDLGTMDSRDYRSLLNCNFQGAQLNDTSFENACLYGINFCDLRNLTQCNFTGARFALVDVAGTDFSDANLTNATLSENVNIKGATKVRGMRYSQKTIRELPQAARWYLRFANLFFWRA